MIYFDNSSTTYFKPKEVIQGVAATLKNLSINASRASHSLAIKAANALNSTREKAAEFFEAASERTIFTYGCTDSLNLAIFGSVIRGGHAITTAFEHNSVLRPLYLLYTSGIIDLTIVFPNNSGVISKNDIISKIKPNTYLIVMNSVSNVTGAQLPIEAVGRHLKNTNILFLVDGAQSAGYKKYDYSLFDMYAVAPHKGLHAPQGIGILTLSKKARLKPFRYGGTGTLSSSLLQPNELPEALESGTLPLPNIIGLNCALNYTKRNFDVNAKKINTLGQYLLDRLRKLDYVVLYTNDGSSGIIAFNLPNKDSAQVCDELNKHGFCVRGGLHCAPLVHKYYGTTKTGMVRVSLGVDNTFSEIDLLINTLEQIIMT